uniref:Mediator of RNA polymerase II transcription subunit 20 n=1 Tax=Myotis myotis TaxID=51298 RepID=A0A7J7WW80_MYOMY|nr:mediator complex subunit 20 [Myotis myotis]
MGVTCVSQMPVAEGKSVQQTVELLTRKLEVLGAEKQGTFCVDCETYHTAASTLGSQEITSSSSSVSSISCKTSVCCCVYSSFSSCVVRSSECSWMSSLMSPSFTSALAASPCLTTE